MLTPSLLDVDFCRQTFRFLRLARSLRQARLLDTDHQGLSSFLVLREFVTRQAQLCSWLSPCPTMKVHIPTSSRSQQYFSFP